MARRLQSEPILLGAPKAFVGAGQFIELYSFPVAGMVTKKRLRIFRSGGTVDKDVAYSYGSDGKLSAVQYPDAILTRRFRTCTRNRYDELNRLISASISGIGAWGQEFTHDGFRDLWTQTVSKGTAPLVSMRVDMATKRLNSSG